MRISRFLVPPGGWQFQDAAVLIREQTWDDLVKTVIKHRESNNIPVGNVEVEIENQIAEAHPEIIINGNKSKEKPMGVSYFHTVQSFVQFLWNWVLKGGNLVDQNTANLRAEICLHCHNNKPSNEVRGGCTTCNKGGDLVLGAVRSQIIKSHKTTSDHGLKVCAVCGCDLKISSWIPNAILLKPDEANAYPSFCWKKKILENTDI